jgi:UbiD family decarboxylase
VIEKTFAIHRSLKMVTVVDDDIDPSNAESVEYAMATRFQADKDLTIVEKVRGSSLDPSSDQKNLLTAKLGIDATKPLSKRPGGFEIAKIPGEDKILLKDYLN